MPKQIMPKEFMPKSVSARKYFCQMTPLPQGSCNHSENFLVKHSKLDYCEDRTMQELAIFYKLENHSRLITSFSTTFKLKHSKTTF